MPKISHTTIIGSKSEDTIDCRQLELIVVCVTILVQKQPLNTNLLQQIVIQT